MTELALSREAVTPEPQIKCELQQWQRERELKEKLATANFKTEEKKRKNEKLKAALTVTAIILVFAVLWALSNCRANTAAKATVTTLQEYETAFNNTNDLQARIDIATEVNRIYGEVKNKDLPKENAEFVDACNVITERLTGGGENE